MGPGRGSGPTLRDVEHGTGFQGIVNDATEGSIPMTTNVLKVSTWWRHPRLRVEHRTSSGYVLRWPSLAVGVLTFVAAHAVEVVMWTSWFGGEWRPFFMNAGSAVAFTCGSFLLAGFLAGVVATDRLDALIHAGNLTAGGAVAMTFILFLNGPGTLFPIAIVVGIYILGFGSYLGALLTLPFKARAGAGGDRQP
jgi:hypothetical protein